jgi:hypothetical protein
MGYAAILIHPLFTPWNQALIQLKEKLPVQQHLQ